MKYPDCQREFSLLGSAERDDDVMKGIELFAYKMYGDKSSSSISDVLTQNFFKSFKSKRNADMLSAVKGCDVSSLSPCYRILYNHILRTEYIAMVGHWLKTCIIWTGLMEISILLMWILVFVRATTTKMKMSWRNTCQIKMKVQTMKMKTLLIIHFSFFNVCQIVGWFSFEDIQYFRRFNNGGKWQHHSKGTKKCSNTISFL